MVLEIDEFEMGGGGQLRINYSRSWELTPDQFDALARSGFSLDWFLGGGVREPIPDSEFGAQVRDFDAIVKRH